jgi:IS5 family transposase
VLEGNASDNAQAVPSLEHHRLLFGRPPRLFTADRGVYSPANEAFARQMGVKQVALPKPGAKTAERQAMERQGWFRRAMRYRAGVEGRISVLKRKGYLGRCRNHGEAGFARWVGWGVLCANLATIAHTVAHR